MPYITRDDGEHFVIPSYRDVLSAKQKGTLKKDILLLSQQYGEYITLQRKGSTQYEVAFSPDPGHLLGESVWHHFKRPLDLVYCEAIPNTNEAILVIVKAGSVYLDGSFPLDSIPEELVIFLTQQNNFEIYIYGDIPISEKPEEGKFSFEASSVKSFTVLDEPIFAKLPLLKAYQLQLVETVLKTHGIGVFPVGKIVGTLIILGLIWIIYSYMTSRRAVMPTLTQIQINPYEAYNELLRSPSPNDQIKSFLLGLKSLFSIPGWLPNTMQYENTSLITSVKSQGGQVEDLYIWARQNKAKVEFKKDGFYLSMNFILNHRPSPQNIYPLDRVVAEVVDQLAKVYPGNNLQLGELSKKAVFSALMFTINLNNVSPIQLSLIGETLNHLPLVLQKINLTVNNGNLNGTIIMEALGS